MTDAYERYREPPDMSRRIGSVETAGHWPYNINECFTPRYRLTAIERAGRTIWTGNSKWFDVLDEGELIPTYEPKVENGRVVGMTRQRPAIADLSDADHAAACHAYATAMREKADSLVDDLECTACGRMPTTITDDMGRCGYCSVSGRSVRVIENQRTVRWSEVSDPNSFSPSVNPQVNTAPAPSTQGLTTPTGPAEDCGFGGRDKKWFVKDGYLHIEGHKPAPTYATFLKQQEATHPHARVRIVEDRETRMGCGAWLPE